MAVSSASILKRNDDVKNPFRLAKYFLAIQLILFSVVSARAATPEVELIIKDHLFFPAILEIPAGQKVRVRIFNQDPTPEEFESFELNREKIVVGNGQTVIFIGPLEAGEYPFFGEFFPKTAQGTVIVK